MSGTSAEQSALACAESCGTLEIVGAAPSTVKASIGSSTGRNAVPSTREKREVTGRLASKAMRSRASQSVGAFALTLKRTEIIDPPVVTGSPRVPTPTRIVPTWLLTWRPSMDSNGPDGSAPVTSSMVGSKVSATWRPTTGTTGVVEFTDRVNSTPGRTMVRLGWSETPISTQSITPFELASTSTTPQPHVPGACLSGSDGQVSPPTAE